MAHYKRRKPRTKPGRRGMDKHRRIRGVSQSYRDAWIWLSNWPRYWDIENHTRPKRRAGQRLIVRIRRGDDPDDLAWPLGNHKPHRYYW